MSIVIIHSMHNFQVQRNFVNRRFRVIRDVPSVDGMLYKDRIVKIDEIKNNKLRVKCSLGKIWWVEPSQVSASFL